jgi:hypothetical protein
MRVDYSLLSFLSSFDWSSWSGLGWGSFGWGSFSSGFGWGSFGWSSFDWSNWGWLSGFLGSFLLLEVLGEEFLVRDVGLFVGFPGVDSSVLGDDLSSNSLLGDESLDVGGFVENFTIGSSGLSWSSDNVLSNIIGLSENESFSNVSGSLWSKSSWSLGIGEAFNFSISLDEDSKGDDRDVGSNDASSAGLSLSLSRSSWSVKGDTYNSIKINLVNQVL